MQKKSCSLISLIKLKLMNVLLQCLSSKTSLLCLIFFTCTLKKKSNDELETSRQVMCQIEALADTVPFLDLSTHLIFCANAVPEIRLIRK